MKLATDGEFRRTWWHFDFLAHLTGCELYHPDHGIQFAGVQTRNDSIRVIGKLDFPEDHPMLAHFKFLKSQCDAAGVTAKMTIPSPAVLHFRGGRKAISKEVYPDLEAFFEDLGRTYRKAVKAFYDARLPLPAARRYRVGIPVLAGRTRESPARAATIRTTLQQIYARVINYAIADRPSDMIITTHVCRGNFRSTWISSGGYEPVAETMLAGTNYDGYFLEYDSDSRRRLRAAAVSAQRQQDRRRRRHYVEVRSAREKRKTSSDALRKPRSSRPLINSPYRRNAASRPRKKATTSAKTSSGPSSSSPSMSLRKCGGNEGGALTSWGDG